MYYFNRIKLLGFESLMVCIEKIINSLVLLIASVKIDIYIERERERQRETERYC